MGDSLQKILIVVLLVAVLGMGYFVYSGRNADDPGPGVKKSSGLLKTEPEFRNKLTELNMQRNKVQRGIKRLEALKQEAIGLLREKGITSSADYKKSEDRDVKFAVVNLKEYSEQISKIEKEVEYYDEAINGIRVMLDRFERERIGESVALSEKDSLELQKIIVDLNERLEIETDIFQDDELGKLLDREMGTDGDE